MIRYPVHQVSQLTLARVCLNLTNHLCKLRLRILISVAVSTMVTPPISLPHFLPLPLPFFFLLIFLIFIPIPETSLFLLHMISIEVPVPIPIVFSPQAFHLSFIWN